MRVTLSEALTPPTSGSLHSITRKTLEQLGFDGGLLLVAGKESHLFNRVVTVGRRLEEMGLDVWHLCLQHLPANLKTVCAIEMLPDELLPAYAIPLLVEDRRVGLLLGTRFSGLATAAKMDVQCQKLSLATYSTVLEWQAERHQQQLRVISKVNEQIPALIARDSKLEAVVQLVQEMFNFYHVSILLFDPSTLHLRLHVAAGAAHDLTGEDTTFLQEDRGIVSWVATHGAPKVVNDVAREGDYYPLQALPATAAEMAIPIQVDGKMIGVLDVQSEQRDAFDTVDLLALQIVANQIGNVLDHATLLHRERSRREMLHTLQETVRVISSNLDPARVLDLILEELGHVVSYDHLRLKQVDGDEARVVAARGFSNLAQVMGTTYRVSENTLASLIVHHQQTISIPEVAQDPRWLWLPGTRKICSWMGVPLVMKERTLGLLSVSRQHFAPFTEEEVEVVNLFARHAAIALDNARLYDELKRFSLTLEERVQERTVQLERSQEELALALNREAEAQETERIRIANELHDSVIQALIATNFHLQSIKSGLVESHPRARDQLSGVQQNLDALVAEIKAIVRDLRPPILESLGLIHAIRQLAASFHTPDFTVRLHVSGGIKSLQSSTERTVYRVVQEALANARAHGGASLFEITLVFAPGHLELLLRDNGSGFDVGRVAGKGLGLVSMRDRARLNGGKLDIESSPGEGTSIRLSLPIRQESA